METDGVVVFFDGVKWDWILPTALSPETTIMAANITVKDVRLVYENLNLQAPESIVGRLTYILYRRFQLFDGDQSRGINIITPFLLADSVKKLESFVIELAHSNNYDARFIDWIERNNSFTN